MGVALALLSGAAGVAIVRSAIGFLRFRARLRTALEATPDIRWQRWTDRGVAVTASGYALELDLIPTYLHLRLRRPREQTLFSDMADALRGRVPAGSVPPLLLVRDRILPVLKAHGSLPPTRGYIAENILARRPLDADVTIAYVIEGQFRITYVTDGMLAAWDLDGAALHALALENLRALTRHLLEEIGGPRGEYAALDGYDAARLLVGDLLIPPGIAEPLLSVPHEHLCLIAPAEREQELRATARQAYREATLRLTAALYRWTAAGPERIG